MESLMTKDGNKDGQDDRAVLHEVFASAKRVRVNDTVDETLLLQPFKSTSDATVEPSVPQLNTIKLDENCTMNTSDGSFQFLKDYGVTEGEENSNLALVLRAPNEEIHERESQLIEGWVKLNTDGDLGVIREWQERDAAGDLQFAFYEFLDEASNVFAELTAIVRGLEYCKE
ncbi:hypothetical protein Pfo_000545 [Paulownia fortunei]|nr:hypothetical protein Pfo_000545 [Paulownia fortunei]